VVQQYSDYVAPPSAPHQQLIPSIESDAGNILLRPNMYGHGYKLGEDAEGFGAGPVENELTPRLGRRGAMLGVQRETEADMFLPIIIRSTHAAEVRRLVAEMTHVMNRADGTFRVILTDPATGESRYRDVAYKDGLETPDWRSPRAVKFTITADYMDPWAYSTQRGEVTIPVARESSGGLQAPVRVPVRVARSGGAVDRWGTNEGEKPAPVTLRFDGPVSDPVVELQGHWAFRVNGSLAWDEYLVVDPQEATATVYSTTSNASRLAYSMIRTGSRFTDLVLPPGQHGFTFRAIDPTFTASMTATWPHTYASMQ
jgi:hypothetical protein